VADDAPLKPVDWIASSYKDFCSFPADVLDAMGYALYRAQLGKKHESAKPLKGFGGSSVVEIVTDFRSDTFRAIYTIRFAGVVYVLHAFQKKAKKGIQTAKHDVEIIRRRLAEAEKDYQLRKEIGDGQ
jgi:phage-related protein